MDFYQALFAQKYGYCSDYYNTMFGAGGAGELVTVGPSDLITINNAKAGKAINVFVNVGPVQSGSGTPSPDNIRQITGWAGANIHVSPTTTGGTVYPVTWSEAGTVYGGTLNVTTGTLTVDRTYVSVASVTNKAEDASGYFWYSTADALGAPAISGLNAGLISDRFVKNSNTTTSDDDGIITFYINNIIRWKEKGDLTLADYRTYLASNPFQLVYELATPIVYQLTPTDITLLRGTNNLWADTGKTTLTYTAI